MIFKVTSQDDVWLQKIYDEALVELGQFFRINWTVDKPKVFIVPNRKTFDKIKGQETPRWLVGYGGSRLGGVYLLDRNNFEKESENIYSEERYAALLKHELAHCFTDILTKSYRYPIWLMEGLSIYLSNQLIWRKKPEKFSKFMNSFDHQREGVYSESGFAIKFLVEKYGKEKIIELLKQLIARPDENKFREIFKETFGVELNYDIFE